jgi:hypothetical protein
MSRLFFFQHRRKKNVPPLFSQTLPSFNKSTTYESLISWIIGSRKKSSLYRSVCKKATLPEHSKCNCKRKMRKRPAMASAQRPMQQQINFPAAHVIVLVTSINITLVRRHNTADRDPNYANSVNFRQYEKSTCASRSRVNKLSALIFCVSDRSTGLP